MGGAQYYRWRQARFQRLYPARQADTPFIARSEAWEIKLRAWRAKVVAPLQGKVQKFPRHQGTYGVHAAVLRAGFAAAVAKEAGV